MGWLDDLRGGTVYKLLYVTPSGREYMVTLTSTGPFSEPPPFVATEREDGLVETVDSLYSSVQELATMHGCIVGEFVSVDPAN